MSRAREPDESGYADRDGVRIHWERHGDGEPTLLLMPPWSIVHSRVWKMQVPYLARHARVITYDGRGNGRSDRPQELAAYAVSEYAADALAVLDATGTDRAIVVGFSAGARWGTMLAADHPERVDGFVCIAPATPLGMPAARDATPFNKPLDRYEGWGKFNRHYWL